MEDEIQEYPETTFRKTNTWTNEETLQFIQLYSVMNSEKNVWNKIVIELKQLGVHKTKAECSKKWSNLMRSYKKVNMELKRNEKNTSKFCFFSEMTQAIEASTKLDSIVGLEEFENNVLVMEVQEEGKIFIDKFT